MKNLNFAHDRWYIHSENRNRENVLKILKKKLLISIPYNEK